MSWAEAVEVLERSIILGINFSLAVVYGLFFFVLFFQFCSIFFFKHFDTLCCI